MDQFVFVVGETGLLQVIDTSKHADAESNIVDMYRFPNGLDGKPLAGTDVSTCKSPARAQYGINANSVIEERLLAAATVGNGGKQSEGQVHLFTGMPFSSPCYCFSRTFRCQAPVTPAMSASLSLDRLSRALLSR